MDLILEGLSKKYPKNKLFENLNYTFKANTTYAITGENGSGKSTLLKIISGLIAPSKGKVKFIEDSTEIEKENIHQFLSITAPYLDLIEEFTLREHLDFHSKFKSLYFGSNILDEIKHANLHRSLDKPIAEFSSGMQQRLKLILCCCFESEIMLLDEPSSHLDTKGIDWYKDLLKRKTDKRITLIASNDPAEYNDFAKKIVNIESRN